MRKSSMTAEKIRDLRDYACATYVLRITVHSGNDIVVNYEVNTGYYLTDSAWLLEPETIWHL